MIERLREIKNAKGKKVLRTLLCSWIAELWISNLKESQVLLINSSDEQVLALYEKSLAAFLKFIKEYEGNMDSETIFNVFLSHGRTDQFLTFALQKNNYETVIIHYINTRELNKALSALINVPDKKGQFALMSKYVNIFMRHITRNTINFLKSDFKGIDTSKFLYSLMSIEREDIELVLDYIRLILPTSSSRLLHNSYVYFLAVSNTEENDKELLDFLDNQQILMMKNMEVLIDKGFVLNVCKRFEKMEAQIQMYGILEFYEEAVKLALNGNNYVLAKRYASMPNDEKIKKKLWIEVVKVIMKNYKAESNDLGELIKESNVLTIGDLLPFVSPNIKLLAFKNDLLASLENYGNRIKELKNDMTRLTESSCEINDTLKNMIEVKVRISGRKYCEVCGSPLLGSNNVFMFPCSHGFHKVKLRN